MAESCTGGWLGKVLSDPPGSSAWFDRALVAYGNNAKTELFGLSDELLSRHGAVSEAAVRGMVQALAKIEGVSLAMALSGISGPGGATPGKPVGTVWIAWQSGSRSAEARRFSFSGNRDAVRRQTVAAALGLIEDEVRRG